MGELTFATWNIGGGILGESHQIAGTANIDYHISRIRQSSPDIICFQEAHAYESGVDQVMLVAEALGYTFFETIAISESHLDRLANLCLGIASRYPIIRTMYTKFPNPNLSALGPNGDRWRLFDKGFSTSKIATPDGLIYVVNAHFFPLHYFGANADQAEFRPILRMLAQSLTSCSADAPTVAAIDLNTPNIRVLSDLLTPGIYSEGFSTTETTPKGIQQDFVLIDNRIRSLEAKVLRTEADHHLCVVLLEIIHQGLGKVALRN